MLLLVSKVNSAVVGIDVPCEIAGERLIGDILLAPLVVVDFIVILCSRTTDALAVILLKLDVGAVEDAVDGHTGRVYLVSHQLASPLSGQRLRHAHTEILIVVFIRTVVGAIIATIVVIAIPVRIIIATAGQHHGQRQQHSHPYHLHCFHIAHLDLVVVNSVRYIPNWLCDRYSLLGSENPHGLGVARGSTHSGCGLGVIACPIVVTIIVVVPVGR